MLQASPKAAIAACEFCSLYIFTKAFPLLFSDTALYIWDFEGSPCHTIEISKPLQAGAAELLQSESLISVYLQIKLQLGRFPSSREFMGTLIGHVAPGAGFLLMGLWHLFNTIRNYVRGPWDFETRPWFPLRRLRHAELYAIICGALLSIAAELFICPKRHQPLADDLSIPPEHLNNFEHSTISLFLLIYAVGALLLDRASRIPYGCVHILGALVFSQELLLFHLHSSDHMGLEGHYHWLLQLIIVVSLGATLMEVVRPTSVLVALVRSMSIVFQGLWFIQMGLILWIPSLTPKNCHLHEEALHRVVRCADEMSEVRAKALATLQFSWYLAGVVVFTTVAFACSGKWYGVQAYHPIEGEEGQTDEVELAVHCLNKSNSLDGSHSSVEGMPAMNSGR